MLVAANKPLTTWASMNLFKSAVVCMAFVAADGGKISAETPPTAVSAESVKLPESTNSMPMESADFGNSMSSTLIATGVGACVVTGVGVQGNWNRGLRPLTPANHNNDPANCSRFKKIHVRPSG